MQKKNLQLFQFFPLLTWPTSLPSIAIGDRIIAGLDSYDSDTLHLLAYESPEKASQQFFDIHPYLTLPEIARVLEHPLAEGWLNKDLLVQNYGYYPSPDFYSICQLLIRLPRNFQDLVGMKKLGLSELLPFVNLKFEIINKIAESILEKSESKSEIAKRIELLSDLILMNQPVDQLLQKSLIELHALRFPETTKRDENLKTLQLPWSSPIRTKMHRKGDSAGFDVQFFASSPVELEKIAESLKKVASTWNSNLH